MAKEKRKKGESKREYKARMLGGVLDYKTGKITIPPKKVYTPPVQKPTVAGQFPISPQVTRRFLTPQATPEYNQQMADRGKQLERTGGVGETIVEAPKKLGFFDYIRTKTQQERARAEQAAEDFKKFGQKKIEQVAGRGIFEKPKQMEFKVGEGLSEEVTKPVVPYGFISPKKEAEFNVRKVIEEQTAKEKKQGAGKEFIKGIARTPVTIPTRGILTLGENVGGQREITPSNRFEKFLLGEEKVKSYTKSGEDYAKMIQDYAISKGKDISKFTPILAAGLSSAEIGLDLVFGGRGKAAEQLVKATSKEAAEQTLKKVGIEATEEAIQKVISIKTKKEAEEFLAKRVAEKAVESKVESPLIQEAKHPTLPKEVSVYDESKAVGAKRIAPDRTAHQQLTPEQGIESLVNKAKDKSNNNAQSWIKASDKLQLLTDKYGDKMPMRTEANIQKYPGLVDDYRTYSNYKKYAINSRTIPEMQQEFIRRSDRIKWNLEMETSYRGKVADEYKQLVNSDISKGYKYPDEVLNYDKSFKTAVDNRARYEKGLRTSFSSDDSRIVFDDKNRIVSGMKRQDGKELLPAQKQEIIDGVLQSQNALGLDLNKMSKDDRWVYSHLNGKNPFLTKNAAGMYRKGADNVSISLGGAESFDAIINGEKVRQKVHTTAAHEIGHALDGKVGGKILDTQTYYDLRRSFKPVENSSRGDKYWNSQSEVTARAMEEYVAVKEGNSGLFNREGYWDKATFESKIKPNIEKAINDTFSQYKVLSQPLQEGVNPLIQEAKLNDRLKKWGWKENSPAYKAVNNPQNILDDWLREHEIVEASNIDKVGYEKAHELANKANIKAIRESGLLNGDYSDKDIVKGFSAIQDQFHKIGNEAVDSKIYNPTGKAKSVFNDLLSGQYQKPKSQPLQEGGSLIQEARKGDYHTLVTAEDGGTKFLKAENAKPVPNKYGLDLFVSKNKDNLWVVSEAKSGKALTSTYGTKSGALESIDGTLQMAKDRGYDVGKTIDESVSKYGATPRYSANQNDVVAKALNSNKARLKKEGFIDPVQNTLGNKSQPLQEGVKISKPTEAGKDKIRLLSELPAGVSPKQISKDPQVFQKDISFLDTITKKEKSQAIINTGKLDISDKGKNFINKTIEEAKPQLKEYLGKTLTNKEMVEFADKTSQTLNRTIGREQTKVFEAALFNTRKKLATMAENGTVDREYIETLKSVKTIGTDIARKLQSLSVKAGTTDLSKQKLLEAILKVNDNTDEILKAAKGVDFTNANEAVDFYRKFIKPTAGEWVDLLRYNSMLSSPTTHIINTFSNAVNTALVAPIEKTLTGTLDFIGGLAGKKREAFAGEGAKYLQGYAKNIGDATQRFSDVMTGKRAFTNLDLKFIPIASKGAKGFLTKALSIPTRFLEASDQFFTALAEGGEKAALGLREGKGVKVPLLELQAKDKAAYRLFRQDLFDKNQGHLLDAVDQFTSKIMALRNNKNPIVSTVAKFTVPFIKTPINFFKQGLEYSPAGFATAFGAKNKVEQLSKAIIGSAVFAGAATMLSSGRITWGEPTSEKQRQEWRQAGVQAYSVKIGDKWYSYQKLAPGVAFPLAIVAAIDDAQKNKKLDESTTEMILSGVAKYGEFLADQSYVKSIGDLLSAAKGGEAGIARVVGNYPQQLIPLRALGGWLARLTDDVQRKVDNKAGFIDKQVQLLMMNIPGLTKKVPARLGTEGQEIPNRNRFLNAISPIRTSTEDAKFKGILEQSEAKRKSDKEHQENLDKAKIKVLANGGYEQVDDTFVYNENGKIKTSTSESAVKLRPTYNQIKDLFKQGKTSEAYDMIDSMSKEDKTTFNRMKGADDEFKQFSSPKKEVPPEKEELKRNVQGKFDETRKLLNEDKTKDAEKIVNDMTDEEYKEYSKIRGVWRAANTSVFRERLRSSSPTDAVKYLRKQPKDEQERILDLMTDEEYDKYNQAKETL